MQRRAYPYSETAKKKNRKKYVIFISVWYFFVELDFFGDL